MKQYQQLSFTFSINRDRGAAGNPFRVDGGRPNLLLVGLRAQKKGVSRSQDEAYRPSYTPSSF